jgi:hypothetical protein
MHTRPWFREGIGVIEAKINKNSVFSEKMHSRVILGEKSITRIPEPW